MGPFGHIPMDVGPIPVLFRGSGPGFGPFRAYFGDLGLDLGHLGGLFLPYLGGSRPGFALFWPGLSSFWTIFALFRRFWAWIWPICSISGVLDLGYFCPI